MCRVSIDRLAGYERVYYVGVIYYLVSFIDGDYDMLGVKVDFSKEETSTDLNELCTNMVLRRMLEGKGYRILQMVFTFVTGSIELATGCTEEAPTIRAHSSHYMLARKLMDRDGLCGFEEQESEELHTEAKELTGLVVNISKVECGFGLYTLKGHLLEHCIRCKAVCKNRNA